MGRSQSWHQSGHPVRREGREEIRSRGKGLQTRPRHPRRTHLLSRKLVNSRPCSGIFWQSQTAKGEEPITLKGSRGESKQQTRLPETEWNGCSARSDGRCSPSAWAQEGARTHQCQSQMPTSFKRQKSQNSQLNCWGPSLAFYWRYESCKKPATK